MASIYARRLMEEDKKNKLGQAGLNGENSVVYTGQPMSDTNYNTGANRGAAPLTTAMNTMAGQAMGAAQKALTEPKATGTVSNNGTGQPASALPTSNDKTMGTVSRLLSAAGGNMQDAPVIATIYNPSMSAPKKAVLENSVMGGSGFKAADGDAGKLHLMKDGSSYVVDENGVWHWYDPSPSDGSLHGAFKNSNGYIYSYDDMTDDELMSHGYVRGADGLVRIASDIDQLRYAVQSGQMTPAQATAQYASRQGTYGPGGGGAPTSGNPGGNAYQQYLSDYDSSYSYKGGRYGAGEPTDYKARRDLSLARAENLRWDYDPDADPVWQAYQKQYRREGDRATREAMAQAASMTGGIPSSYAATAASQAGDYYASQLSDKIPQLYQDAYNRYLSEFQKQLQISDQYAGFDDREYSRDYQARRDAINDARYDQEWAQKLREYADQQGWQATEWEQYLKEYGDQLSEKEREWAYQQKRDAISDARYEDSTAWERAIYEDETAYNRGRDAIEDERKAQEYADEQMWKNKEWDYGVEQDALENERKAQEYADEQGWKQTEWEQYLKEHDENQAENERTWAYKERAYTDQQKATAWSFFETYGFVPEEYADVLGIPAGTKWDDYMAQYGMTSDEPVYNTGGYRSGRSSSTRTSDTAPEPDEAGNEGRYEFTGERHPNGNLMTKGYKSNLSSLKLAKKNGTPDKELRSRIRSLILTGEITNYEGARIMAELGMTEGVTTPANRDRYMVPFGE